MPATRRSTSPAGSRPGTSAACRSSPRTAKSRITRTVVALALLLAAPAAAAPELRAVGEFSAPVQVAAPPGDERLFVVEQAGRIRLLDAAGTLAEQPFLDIASETSSGGERGLLGLAFAPDYAKSGELFVYLTARQPAGEIQIRRYTASTVDPNRADPASGVTILRQAHARFPNHNGGGLRFGPDGKLWASLGDGGGSNDPLRQAQDRTSLLGKLLRLERDGSPAAGNPFLGAGDGVRPEIWHYGLRNAFRFAFDRVTGDLFLGDVGQGAREEIDVATAAEGLAPGANWGWPCFEGTRLNVEAAPCTAPGARAPALELDHDTDDAVSIVGGVVVRDPGVPTLAGRYLFTDLAYSELRSVIPGAGTARVERDLVQGTVVSIDEDGCGRVLVTSLAGRVARLVDGQVSPCSAVPGPGGTGGYGTPVVTTPPAVPVSACGLRAAAPERRTRRRALRRGVAVTLSARAACRVEGRPRAGRAFGPVRSVELLPGATRSLRLRVGAARERLRAKLGVRLLIQPSAGGRAKLRHLKVRINP